MKWHLNQFKQLEISSSFGLTQVLKNVIIRGMNFIYILELEKQFVTLFLRYYR